MPLEVDWRGVFPAVPTQFHDDYSLNIPGTQAHVEALLDDGIHGLVMLGTIGENCSLSLDEKAEVLRATVEVANGRVPVLTGIAEYTTAGACETVRRAKEAGVDGLMVMPAMVYNSDARETIAHFRTVADSTDLPIMCYNNPPVYRVDITPEMFLGMMDVDNIVCIKEASGNTVRFARLHRLDLGSGRRIPEREPHDVGRGDLRRLGACCGNLPLVHADAAFRQPPEAGAVRQADLSGDGLRQRTHASPSPAGRRRRAREDPGHRPAVCRNATRVTERL
jgi:hypothetical protein